MLAAAEALLRDALELATRHSSGDLSGFAEALGERRRLLAAPE